MSTNIKSLQKETEERDAVERSFSANPYKKLIQSLFQSEFSGTKYKKYTKETAKAFLLPQLKEISNTVKGPYLTGGNNLIRKLEKSPTLEQFLLDLNEYLFS